MQRKMGASMEQYVFSADLLNKFSQLTPWVQAIIGISLCAVLIGFFYFFKETVATLMKPFHKTTDKGEKEAADVQE